LEFEIMKEDIRRVKDFGADGVVFGILKPDGSVDVEGTHELLELARPLGVTFHRAFDMTADPHAALEALAGIGVDRVLTSGQRNKAAEGAPLLAELVRQAGSRIAVMIGSGVNPANIARLIARTGAREFHVSGRKSVPSAMQYRNPNIFMGGIPDIPEYETSVTDEKIIHSLVEAAHAQA
jgi:copper homeostasis protein